MKDKINALTVASEGLRQTRLALDNLAKQEADLKDAYEKLSAQLAKLPAEALTVSENDGRAFDRATSRMVSARSDIRIKLDLLPGIRVRYQAQGEGLRQQLRAAAKALIHRCRDLAAVKLDGVFSEVAVQLLPQYGGVLEDAKAAAARVLLGPDQWDLPGRPTVPCSARKWLDTFSRYEHLADPLEDAAAIIVLAESFERGESAD